MKTTTLDRYVLAALLPIVEDARENIAGVLVEIEPRAVAYIATDAHILFAHRVEIEAAAPDNTLLGAVLIPAEVCSEIEIGEGQTATLAESGDPEKPLILNEIAFAPLPPLPLWRGTVPESFTEKPAQLDPSRLLRLDNAAFDLSGGGGKPHVRHNGPGRPCAVTWERLPQSFAMIMPLKPRQPAPLPAWVRSEAPAAARELETEAGAP